MLETPLSRIRKYPSRMNQTVNNTAMNNDSLLSVLAVSKNFSGVQALTGVNLHLMSGERLALIGQNGAGKSTLMKILAGVFPADCGQIKIRGTPVQIYSVSDALKHGIALIHQELNLVPNLDIGSNIFLGREPQHLGLIDPKLIHRNSSQYLKMVGLDVSPARLVRSLSIGQRQLVEIAKALATDAQILIMDEPTSSLSPHETNLLFEVIKDLSNKGVGIIYISHRLGEVKSVATRVEVLRDGRNAGSLEKDLISHNRMVSLMVGRNIAQFYQHLKRHSAAIILKVENLRTQAFPNKSLSFQIKAGEIVGMGGLVGAGRTAILQTIFGIFRPLSGYVSISGKILRPGSPLEAIQKGIALVPGNRQENALILDTTVRFNLSLASLRRDQKLGFVGQRREKVLVNQIINRLSIRGTGSEQLVKYLSGGNQQKVVLGRWLAMSPSILLLDEPTRGVDVGSKQQIYRVIEELAAKGVAVLFVSSEMEELLGLSDRIIVVHEGGISGDFPSNQSSENKVLNLASGIQ